jgi:CheY-like chemotaxis protein
MVESQSGDEKTGRHYCTGCGEEVPTYAVRSESGVEYRCTYCGLPLERRTVEEAQTTLECILLADDEKLIRWLLRDVLTEKRLAHTVVACETGGELLTRFVERQQGGERTDLIILDILMRELDGVATSRALRAIERGYGITRPVPILFLSGLRPDTALRNFVARMQPALFLNKAVDATPERLAERLQKMVNFFAHGPGEQPGGPGRPPSAT